MREKRLITEEKRVIIDERRERADVVIPVRVREVDEDWIELLDTAPPGDYKSCMSDLLQVKDIL